MATSRSLYAVAIAAVLTSTATPVLSQASNCGPLVESVTEWAQDFAPVLRFAPEEAFFPTLPLSPWVRVDLRNGRHVLLRDQTEPLPLAASVAGDELDAMVDLDVVIERYRSTVSDRVRPGSAAGYYRASCLDELDRNEVLAALAVDSRSRDLTRLATDATIVLLEYYFYYLYDNGFGGTIRQQGSEAHVHDTEKAFVFLVVNGGRIAAQVWVGAAHGPITPNNVLVLPDSTAFVGRPNFLVELGKHAMAPDVPPHGEFVVGEDVNRYMTPALWGIRDDVSLLDAHDAYDPGQSLPRDRDDAVVLVPFGAEPPPDRPDAVKYVLFADWELREFYSSAIRGVREGAHSGLIECRAEPQYGELHSAWERRNGSTPLPVESAPGYDGWTTPMQSERLDQLGPAALLRAWPTKPCRGGDEDYKGGPASILKADLFSAPRRPGLEWNHGVGPTWAFFYGLPIRRLVGRGDGTISAGVGTQVDLEPWERLGWRVRFDQQSNNLIWWYAAVGDVTGSGATPLEASVGIGLAPGAFLSRYHEQGPLANVEMRVGWIWRRGDPVPLARLHFGLGTVLRGYRLRG